MGNLVRGKIITTKVFVFLDETSYFKYCIFSDWHFIFVMRNKKKILHLLCIALPANSFHCQNKCDKWGYNWSENTSSVQFKKWIGRFDRNLERRNISRSSNKSFRNYILFSKNIMYDNIWEWTKIYEVEFSDDKAITLKQLASFSPLLNCYVCRGTGWG